MIRIIPNCTKRKGAFMVVGVLEAKLGRASVEPKAAHRVTRKVSAVYGCTLSYGSTFTHRATTPVRNNLAPLHCRSTTMLAEVATSFMCKCGRQQGWISADKYTSPCPDCGRVYHGIEKRDRRGVTNILPVEVKERCAQQKGNKQAR